MCSCDDICEWGPVQSNQNKDLQQWTEYFQSGVNLSSDQEINVCKSHYVTMHHAKCARTCELCNSASAPQWMLGKVILKESGSASNNMELDPLNWVCKNCFKCHRLSLI